MIYLFGKGKNVSVVYDETTLTKQDKVGGIAVASLPPKEDKEGFHAILCLDASNKPYWEYVEIPKDTLEDLVRKELITKEQYKTLTGKDFTV
jgi:predicted RNA-binding protein associated with RNAse of E/G family